MIPHAVVDEREETVGDNVAKETKSQVSSQDKARVTSKNHHLRLRLLPIYFIQLQKMRVTLWLIKIFIIEKVSSPSGRLKLMRDSLECY